MIDRAGLIEVLDGVWRDFLEHPPADVWDYGIRMTSGTTNNTPLIAVNVYPRLLRSRFRNVTSLLVCYGSLNIRLAYARHTRCQESSLPMKVLLLDGSDLDQLPDHLDDVQFDCIVGFPSFVIRVSELLSSAMRTGIRSLQFAGEALTEVKDRLLKDRFPNAPIVIMTYILNEIGVISAPSCGYLSLNQYHPAPGVVVEHFDPDASDVGELLVTKKIWRDVVVEQYRTGDMVLITHDICACGADVTFRVLGRRGYDYIKIAGGIIRQEEFERVAHLFAQYIDDYRVEVREVSTGEGLKGSIVLRVFRRGGPVTSALASEIARDFSKEVFLTPTQTLSNLVAQRRFLPLVIDFSRNPFPQKHKDVKLSRSPDYVA